VDGQDEASSEHVITCGHELLGSEALSSQALEWVDLEQPLAPCRRAEGIGGQHEQLRVATARPEIAQHLGEGFEFTPMSPGNGVGRPGHR
jgi:hypothetical protein